MRIDIVSLFPEIVEGVLKASLLGRAVDEGLIEVAVTNPRDFSADKHRSVDDAPYGGGAGMVMQCGPLFAAVESLRGRNSCERVVLMSPRGRRLDQEKVKELAAAQDLVIVCARYEGVDERVSDALVTEEISIGDYVLNGGELPALVMVEAIGRMIPGVVGKWESVDTDSFFHGLLGPPQYTRPTEFREMKVPAPLLAGDHAAIGRWRRKEALRVTRARRPDLLKNLTEQDLELLAEAGNEAPVPERENEP